MSEQTDADLMVGSTVHQVTFIDEMGDTVVFASLSKARADNFVQQVKDYDAGFVKGSKHDLDGSYDAAHPLARWRENIASGGSLVHDIENLEGKSWASYFERSDFVLQ